MGKIIPFPQRPESAKPVKIIAVEAGQSALDALDKCAKNEDLNPTAAYNRGVVLYANMMEALRELKPGDALGLQLPNIPNETFLIVKVAQQNKKPKRRWFS